MTPTEAATLTTDQHRDWCARDDGWHYEPAQVDGLGAVAQYWWRYTIGPSHGGRTYAQTHPYPPTRDGAAKAMPEGYAWERWAFDWVAWKHGSRVGGPAVRVPDTGVEIADRFRLAVLCRMAAREVKG